MTRSCTSKAALAPDPRELDERAARAWTERMAVTPAGGGVYHVETESGRRYAVDVPGRRCTCPDYRYRGARCKHRRRVAIEITEGRVPPPGKRAAECAACGRGAFVHEDRRVPLCPDCEPDPGEAVLDRETGDRLLVRGVRDRRADEVAVPDTGCTVADYPTNGAYPGNDPVVEAVYADDPRDGARYAFPLSRLDPDPDP